MEEEIFIGLGSNVGNRTEMLAQARLGLVQGGCRIVRQSHVYETPPWGLQEQPAFLNQVLQVSSPLSPWELLDLALGVEAALGRQRTQHWGPRTIDIDLLAIGRRQLLGQRLTLPHPLAHERAFVLLPWSDIAPDFSLPGKDGTIAELLGALPPGARDGLRRLDP